MSFVLLQTNSASEIHVSIIQTNSSKTAVCVTHRAAAASPKIFPVFTGEVTRVRYPVLCERYRHLPAVATDGVGEFPVVQKPVAISVGVGEEPQTGPPAGKLFPTTKLGLVVRT